MKLRLPRPLIAAAAAATVLAACDASPPAPETPPITRLGDTPWRLVSVAGNDVGSVDVVLRIAGGFVSGKGPCNSLTANYLGEAPEFQIEAMATSNTTCDRRGLENRIFEALLDARSAVVANETLTLSGPDGEALVFRPAA
ncbi:MAG: META domain-containing protein [Pseudomonadota bacterium]